ncbi:uncharacterized protein LOC112055025 [Bicyclus anynana]|uniref:Uncharacterized protein LOC112055025 n=1 Tax=Bicyclus anynana TaxID=110368 RepID=A0A6J1NVM5_BICAN|nr:uncharacterized protein LOC112055025 [Bicyclus anynana]
MTEAVYLPYDVLELIFRKVNGLTLGRCRRVCKYWKEFIDSSEYLWRQKCRNEFKHASRIAKRKCGHQCNWYHIYRNLCQWSDLKNFDLELKEFYKFSHKDNLHILDIDHGLLPLRGNRGTVLYDTSTLENITVCVSIPDRDCLKIANNDNVTIIQVKSGVFIERTADDPDFVTEAFINGDGFALTDNYLFVYINKDIYSLDLRYRSLSPNFIMSLEYSIKEMVYSDNALHLFIGYGYIVSLLWDPNSCCWKPSSFKPIDCPVEWIKQIKHICAADNRNYVCYSRNLIKIQVEKYKHLYLEFPTITALFFYVDITIFGTQTGEILLYRLSSQAPGRNRPTFETLIRLPEGEVALQLDVCERRTGPLIVISTCYKLYVIEAPFFPDEQQTTESSFTSEKLNMYKRMRKLKEWMKISSNNNSSQACKTKE